MLTDDETARERHKTKHKTTRSPSIISNIKMPGPVPNTNFWRIAGMTYLQYTNRAAGAVRNALKEPAKSKLAAQGQFSYQAASWTAGEQGLKTEITTLGGAGKSA